MSVDDTSFRFSRSQSLTMDMTAPKIKPTESPIPAEIVNSETVNDGKRGIVGRCLNPLGNKPLETKPGAIWRRTSCGDDCRNTLSAFRRVACALFPELEPAHALETLLSRVRVETAKNDSVLDVVKEAADD